MLACLRRCSSRSSSARLFHDVRVYKEDKRWPGWQVVIGIETHAQIKSRRKLFSDSLTSDIDEQPNTHVSPFDAAFPGTLPKLNPKCVDLALRTALALQCDIQRRSSFDRKHYFYSDQPTGYQITQQYAPIALNGALSIQVPNSDPILVRIKQIQLEQDTAKSAFNPRHRTSHIDLNRAGTGLMEIVTEPDLRSPEEAGAYVRTLQAVLRAIGSSDGNMEQGSLRCDVNVSVNQLGDPPGTRCEIKNLNSVRFIMAAIVHEVHRQRVLLDSGVPSVPQETRGFDEHTFETYRMRSKEDAPDYRYMPDPNLGVLLLSEDRIHTLLSTLPELPPITRARLQSTYNLSLRTADVLLGINSGGDVPFDGEHGDGGAVAYFDALCAGGQRAGEGGTVMGGRGETVSVEDKKGKRKEGGRDPKVVLNWMTHELLGQLAARKESFRDNTISVGQLGELIDLVQEGTITGTSGKFLLRHMLANPSSSPTSEIAKELELLAFSPSSSSPPPSSSSSSPTSPSSSPTSPTSPSTPISDELHTLCTSAISALPAEAAAFRAGHKNVVNKIVGRVMRESRGRADARVVKEVVEGLILKEGGGGSGRLRSGNSNSR